MRPQRSISQLTPPNSCMVLNGLVVPSGTTTHYFHLPAGGMAAPEQVLREERGAGLGEHAGCLLYVGGSDLDVFVAGQRLGNEPVEHRVLELFPPLGVHCVPGIRRFVLKDFGMSSAGRR